MLSQLKQEDLRAQVDGDRAGTPGATGGAGGAQATSAASKQAQAEITALALQQLNETKIATLESMRVSHASQIASMQIGMMTETESQLLKTAQAYLQLAGQAHALINAGIQ